MADLAPTSSSFALSLLGRFELAHESVSVPVAPASQRLLAFVALAKRRVSRDMAAGILWPESSERCAHANLRAALARLRAKTSGVVWADRLELGLEPQVGVDLVYARATAQTLLQDAEAMSADAATAAISGLACELLPGWYEDWVLIEAEGWRQLRLHALEAVAGILTKAGRFGEAVVAAQLAVDADPLRESSHAALIAVHISEGNQSEAVREFQRYRTHLNAALGIEPTARLRALLAFDGHLAEPPPSFLTR